MRKMTKLTLIAIFGVAVLCAGSVKKAEAFSLRFTEGVTVVTITDGGVGDTIGTFGVADGMIGFSGKVGVFGNITATIGSSKPVIGSAADPGLNLVSVYTTSSGAGSLQIELSDMGFNGVSPSVTGFRMDMNASRVASSSAASTAAGSIDASLFYSNSNLEFVRTTGIGTIAPIGANTLGSSFAMAPGLSADYSLTLVSNIVHNQAGFTSYDVTASAVPEPGTIALLGIGLAGLVGVGVRRRAKKNAV